MTGGSWSADVLVIFGITGDLAHRMTIPALYELEQRGLLGCPIVGVAGRSMSTSQLVDLARKAVRESGFELVESVFARFAARLSYVAGDVTGDKLYEDLVEKLADYRRPLYYLEMPPALFEPIAAGLGKAGLLRGARLAIEKPFGHDLASARELNARLCNLVDERQILRVDHFLGKQPVIELEYLRFANFALARLWDRESVTAVEITMAETLTVADRGRFYDEVGALRDVVQNHLLQVLALVAMDPPVGPGADDLHDKQAELLRAIPAADPDICVRGQYDGYRETAGVAADSDTETYAALRLTIDNARWSGVPVFIRTGKALPEHVTEVRLFLRDMPRLAFLPDAAEVEGNQIVLRIDPDAGLRLQLTALADNQRWRPVRLDTSFVSTLGPQVGAYERVLHAALTGDDRLFARQDFVEESWRIIEPLLSYPPPLHGYEPGSWGPPQADRFAPDQPPWQQPWVPEGDH